MTAVQVDSTMWVDHFCNGNAALGRILMSDSVLCRPWVLGEIACGTPPRREQTLADLAALQTANTATLQELMIFAERERLYGLGCGLVDLGLLAPYSSRPARDCGRWTSAWVHWPSAQRSLSRTRRIEAGGQRRTAGWCLSANLLHFVLL